MRLPLAEGLDTTVILAMVLLYATGAYAFCFDEAGSEYRISDDLLRAIAHHESGNNPGAVNYNKNGSYDYGLMQINSGWYSTLGPRRWAGLGNPCFNTKVGAWILSRCIQKHGYTWEAVGCYNAKSKDKRVKYAWRIYNSLKRYGKERSPVKSNMHISMSNVAQEAR
ncbi:MAG: lytic transglycosylase domain-containing protein [Nitrospirae bacterium]|nr:lytic transglycosylase domain-containing protein [Nitrospirota bacterium]MCL5238370.1 lytic transglycosylase domain-containing protein [Nitrospirota bacterium]